MALVKLHVCIAACIGFNIGANTGEYESSKNTKYISIGDLAQDSVHSRIQRSSDTGLADIARFVDKSQAGRNYLVYCDDTMKRLIFRVETLNATPIITATRADGTPYTSSSAVINTYTNGSRIALLEIQLVDPNADVGNWTFTRNDSNTWDVTVQGESPVFMTHNFVDIRTGKVMRDNELIASHRYRLTITVTGVD